LLLGFRHERSEVEAWPERESFTGFVDLDDFDINPGFCGRVFESFSVAVSSGTVIGYRWLFHRGLRTPVVTPTITFIDGEELEVSQLDLERKEGYVVGTILTARSGLSSPTRTCVRHCLRVS
jgi:hypothetical protein